MRGEAGKFWRAAAAMRKRAAGLDGEAARDAETDAERLEARCDEILAALRARDGDGRAPTVLTLLADKVPIEEPDELSLALLVEAVDEPVLIPEWQRRAIREALAWLIAQSRTASERVAELLSEVDDAAEPGALLFVAKGRS